MNRSSDITRYHAHVYFEPDQMAQARTLCEKVSTLFGVAMGRVHAGPVGPHPLGSCQLVFKASQLADMVPYLLQARGSLPMFIHGLSGDDLRDHTQLAMWLGDSYTLDLSVFDSDEPVPAGDDDILDEDSYLPPHTD